MSHRGNVGKTRQLLLRIEKGSRRDCGSRPAPGVPAAVRRLVTGARTVEASPPLITEPGKTQPATLRAHWDLG